MAHWVKSDIWDYYVTTLKMSSLKHNEYGIHGNIYWII